MKQQIVVIHGGNSFRSYRYYLHFLKTAVIQKKSLYPRHDWKKWLYHKLKKDYDVLLPQMPSKTNAKYDEWKIWFDKITQFLEDNLILIGHSLGGIFLTKYLSEINFPKKIRATFLIAAPFDDSDSLNNSESVADFALPPSLNQFVRQSPKIYLIYSSDDPIVPVSHLNKYKKKLPTAKTLIYHQKGHFNQKNFPEIIEIIKSINEK